MSKLGYLRTLPHPKMILLGRVAHPGLRGAPGEDGLGMANLSLINHLAVELRDTIKNQGSGAFRKHFWAFNNGTKSRSFKSMIKSHKLSFQDHGQQNTMNKWRHSHHPGYARPSTHCTWFCPKVWFPSLTFTTQQCPRRCWSPKYVVSKLIRLASPKASQTCLWGITWWITILKYIKHIHPNKSGNVLEIRKTAVTKTDKNTCLHGAGILVEWKRLKKKKNEAVCLLSIPTIQGAC